jgi:uncharacterized protein
MDGISIGLWVLTLIMGGIAFSRPGKLHRQGVKIAWVNIVVMVPRIAMAILIAGFFAVILPSELVASWLGQDSGLTGILIGSVAGGLTPGGPMLSFPIIAILFKAGAGVGPLIAYLTAWSVYAIHRVFAFEIPMMGTHFAVVRLLSSIILPFLAGILAIMLDGIWTIRPY